MMESILKTIGEVRMEIVGQKNTHHKKDSEFSTRESKSWEYIYTIIFLFMNSIKVDSNIIFNKDDVN